MNGLYKVIIKEKEHEDRLETALSYFQTTLFCEVEQLTDEIDTDNYYRILGTWTKSVFDRFQGNQFEVVFEMKNDWLTRFWYIDEDNTIRQITD